MEGSYDIYKRTAMIFLLNCMQHSINYSLKFAPMFKYFCDRFFSKKNLKEMCKGVVHYNCVKGVTRTLLSKYLG